MSLKLAGALVGLVLLAGPAAAQTGGPYDKLSADDRGHVDALYLAQQPAGKSTLGRDEIAARKGPAGWGGVFDDLKAQGYYPAGRSFADVVRAFYRPPSAAAKDKGRAGKAAGRPPLFKGKSKAAPPQNAGTAK